MRRFLVLVFCAFLSFSLIGCTKKAESSSAAIEAGKKMEDLKARADYLVSQAKAFYNSKDFQGAIDIAQHVLSYVDSESQAAKDLIQKAKDQLSKMAQEKMDEAKKKMGF